MWHQFNTTFLNKILKRQNKSVYISKIRHTAKVASTSGVLSTKKSKWYLLSVPGKSYRPIIIVFKDNVPQLSVRNIFYYMPLDWKEPIPLVKLPKFHVFIKVHLSHHLSNTHKLSTSINLENDSYKRKHMIGYKTLDNAVRNSYH